VADAVERAVVVDPARHRRRRPRRAGAEEQHVLLGDPKRQQLAEELREPGAAGPDDVVGLQHVIAGDHARTVRSRRRVDPARARPSSAARHAERACQASSPCEQRISRDSPPEPARTWPAATGSTSVTSQPSRASWRAVAAPNAPAPQTMTEGTPRNLLTRRED